MFRLLFISIIALSSCASSTVVSESTDVPQVDSYNVQFTITRPIPYCGGAAPTEDMLNRSAPVTEDFILINVQTNKKTTVRTDENGVVRLALPDGKYILKEKFKDVSFEKFWRNTSVGGQNINVGSEDCYKKWWATNLSEFEILPKTPTLRLQLSLYKTCYTGNNPCDVFTGPYPPSAPPSNN